MFRAVDVMACDNGIIPLQNRIDRVGDDFDLEEAIMLDGIFFMLLASTLKLACL